MDTSDEAIEKEAREMFTRKYKGYYHGKRFQDEPSEDLIKVITEALRSIRDAERAECADIARAIDSKRGNEEQIARAIENKESDNAKEGK